MKKIVALAGSLMLPMSMQATAAPLDAEQQKQVQELVRKTLVENPEIIVEAINELKRKEMETQREVEKNILSSRAEELFNNPADPVLGNPKGKVAIAYFGDFNCGYCKRQDPILEKLAKDFPDLKIVYKQLPVLGPESTEAAQLALAAFKKDPKNYFEIHNRLMSKPGRHTSESIKAALKAEGVDASKLNVTDDIKKQLENNMRIAQDLGIRGTPALVLQDTILRGYTEEPQLAEMVKARLKK